MNRNKLFLGCYILMAGLFTGCSNDADETNSKEKVIALRASVSNMTTRVDNPDTKIITGQAVGVTIVNENDDSTISAHERYIAQDNGTLSCSGTSVNYPAEGTVKIKAYHPMQSVSTFDFIVKADQSVNQDYYDSDLLYAEKTNIASSNNAVDMEFNHQLSKLTYTLSGSFAAATQTVSVVGVETKVSYEDGTITNLTGNTGTVVMNSNYGAIVVPQATIQANQIRFKIEDGDATYYSNYITTTAFKAGYSYKFALNLSSSNGLTVSTEEISGWINTNGTDEEGHFTKVEKNFIGNGDFEDYAVDHTWTASTSTPSIAGEWHLRTNNSYTGTITATVQNDDSQGNYISFVTDSDPKSWYYTYIGQLTKGFERTKYELTFKAKTNNPAKIFVAMNALKNYNETGNTGAGGQACFIVADFTGNVGDTSGKYCKTIDTTTEWVEYSAVFDFNFFMCKAATGTVYSTSGTELMIDNQFILLFHQHGPTQFGTLNIDDVKLVKAE